MSRWSPYQPPFEAMPRSVFLPWTRLSPTLEAVPETPPLDGSEMHIFVVEMRLPARISPEVSDLYAREPSHHRDLGRGGQMADINKFSEQVIDLAERLADMSDAAKARVVADGVWDHSG